MKTLFHIMFLFLCQSVYAQISTEITVSNFESSVKPGSHITIFFECKNVPESVDISIEKPGNWQTLVKKEQKLTENSNKYTYTFAIPKTAKNNDYPISFLIERNNAILQRKDISIRVEEIRQIDVSVLSKPDYVHEGDTLEVEYLVQNLGNVNESLKFSVTSGIIQDSKDTLTIMPLKSESIRVKKVIPITEMDNWQTSVVLKVLTSYSSSPITNSTSLPVYSNSSKKIDRFNRFPVEIGGSYFHYNVGGVSQMTYQYVASGTGFLDEEEKNQVDFVIQGPNRIEFPTMGSYDQYSLNFNHLNTTKVSIGDYVNRVSNLLEFSRFGRGMKFEQSFSNLSFSTFYQKSRFSYEQKDAFGGNVVFDLNERFTLGANYINKGILVKSNFYRTSIYSLSSTLKKENFTMETEGALGQFNNRNGLAFSNRLFLKVKKINLNSNVITASKDFYGFYNNSQQFINGLNLQLNKKTSFGINSNYSSVNPSLDIDAYYASPVSKTQMIFTSFQPNSKNLLFINYSIQERDDRQPIKKFNYKENFGNITYSLNSPFIILLLQGRYGKSQNLLVKDNSLPKESFSTITQPSIKLFKSLWMGGYFEHQHTSKFSSDNSIENLFFYGGNLNLSVKRKMNLSLTYRNNFAPDELFQKRSFADATFSFDFKSSQILITGGEAFLPNAADLNQNTSYFSVKFITKLNTPISKKSNLGHVAGSITGLNPGMSKAGIIMQLGPYKAPTNKEGVFRFDNIKPDDYYLSISNLDLLNGWVSSIQTPVAVTVKTDSTSKVEIPLLETGGITGKVDFVISERIRALNPEGFSNAVRIKLYNENENYMTQINKDNTFSFKEIKPGEWKIMAILPKNEDKLELVAKEKSIVIQSRIIIEENFLVKSVERKVNFTERDYKLSLKK